MKMPCNVIHDLLPLYCDEACSQESRQAVEDHLRECPSCCEEARLMAGELPFTAPSTREESLTQAAASLWKRGRVRALLTGGLFVLLGLALLTAVYVGFHWFSTASEDDLPALTRQAEDYLRCSPLSIVETEQRGNYLAALCTDGENSWKLCVFDRDRIFPDRWRANGGSFGPQSGTMMGSWNYGSPQMEAVLVFYGGGLSDEIGWYTFQNGGVEYTCPVEGNTVLDVFIIPDSWDINSTPTLLNREKQELP